MKTYIVTSATNYDLMVHVVNAENEKDATTSALKKGAWEGCEVFEIDTKTEGVVFNA
jgi:hypothetical protein